MATAILLAASTGRPDAKKPWSVLLVDDTEDLRFIMRRLLQASPKFRVEAEAENGQAAIEVASRVQPDLVLLDLLMPVMDGWEALPRIRAKCPRARIVVVSGQDRTMMERRALELGASAYIEKGTPSPEIVRTLMGVMER